MLPHSYGLSGIHGIYGTWVDYVRGYCCHYDVHVDRVLAIPNHISPLAATVQDTRITPVSRTSSAQHPRFHLYRKAFFLTGIVWLSKGTWRHATCQDVETVEN